MESISVVICTRQRPEQLERCLASFSEQSLQPHEIIVVDNSLGEPATRQIAERHRVTYLVETRKGLDFARNRGLKACKADLIAYTDDDTILHKHWLRQLRAAFTSPEIWGATGLVLPAELNNTSQCIFEKEWGFGRGFAPRDFGPEFYARTRAVCCPVWEIGAGASMAFRRKIFDRLGPFDIRLDAGASGCSGDSEMWYRILHAGGTCRYQPSSVVSHFHRSTEQELRSQIRAYMRGHVAALLVQHRKTGDGGNLRRIYRTLPKWYLKKLWRRLVHPINCSTSLIDEEIRGCIEGINYYRKARNLPPG